MTPSRFWPLGVVLLATGVALTNGCSGDAETAEDDLAACARPDAGPLTVATHWVRPGEFVNVGLSAEHASATVSASPLAGSRGAAQVTSVGDRGVVVAFDASANGFFRIAASEDGAGVGEVVVRVATQAPAISADTRGSFVVATQIDSRATLAARAVDAAGKGLRVKVAGSGVALDASGGLRTQVSVSPGLSFVPVTLVDAACNEFPTTIPVVAAPAFEGEGESQIRAKAPALALVAQLVSPKLAEYVKVPGAPAPVADRLGFKVLFDGATLPGQSLPSGAPNPGAMTMGLSLRGDRLGVDLRASSGVLVGHARINGNAATITVSNLVIQADVATGHDGHLSISVTKLDGTFAYNLEGYPDWIGSLFESKIRDGAKSAIEQTLPGVLEKALFGLQGEIAIPARAPGSGGAPSIGYALRDVSIGADALTVRVATTRAGAPHFGAPLAPAREGDLAAQLGYDSINQALFALWNKNALGIGLDADDLRSVGEKLEASEPTLFRGAQVQASIETPKLPPVITPGAAAGSVRVGVAQIPMSIFVQSSGVTARIDVEVGLLADVALSADARGVSVGLSKLVELHVETRSPSSASGVRPDVVSRVVELAAERLAKNLGMRVASLELPAFDLAGLGLKTQVSVVPSSLTVSAGSIQLAGSARVTPVR